MNAQVAVAVVSWNFRDLLAKTLESLRSDADSGLIDVWVVDNASSDGSAEMVAERFPWVTLVASEENLGYGPAVNLVAARTDTPWITAANADIEVRRGAIERLLAAARDDPEAAILVPRLELPDGSTQHSVRPFPTLWLALLFNTGMHRLSGPIADHLCLEGRWDPARPRRVDWAMAAFMLVRRTAWDSVGGFDEAQWMHAEDLDLAWRLRRAGWRARYEPGAEVLHVGSVASKEAFGDELVTRFMAASYAWQARRRGLPVARAVALVNCAGALARLGVVEARARLRGERPDPAAVAGYRSWLAAHRTGLMSRDELRTRH